jgi:hypothetical protein
MTGLMPLTGCRRAIRPTKDLHMTIDRRNFLNAAFATGAATIAALSATTAFAGVCYDPNTLPLSQKNRRRSLGYVEISPDPSRRCMGCAYFTAAEEGCGKCAMLNSTVNSGAVCNSFVQRPK